MASRENEIVIFWFRRDLRLEDNAGLWHALTSGHKVLPVFIYDSNILGKLEPDDIRMSFLRDILEGIYNALRKAGSSLLTISGTPAEVFKNLNDSYAVKGLYFNHDYDPYAIERDNSVKDYFKNLGIPFFSFKDQVIFERDEVIKSDGKPYTVFTPYSKKWHTLFDSSLVRPFPSETLLKNLVKIPDNTYFSPEKIRFKCPPVKVKSPVLDPSHISAYDRSRDIPSLDGGSYLGPHLRFGTISIRDVFRRTESVNSVFTNELIWREFFMQILWHFPHVTENSFRRRYDRIRWLNNEEHFVRWCDGNTGFPLVDAGMRELNQTGYMHNRVRMVAANFLTRHLLTDWRWGEAWFASRLLDFELSSNNGNWQWAAGTGCDAVPYFRVFNPATQVARFDPGHKYIKKWIPEFGTPDYPPPVVDHKAAREQAISFYRNGINS
jgi:deoxyribodipyrimidine photo-lyase